VLYRNYWPMLTGIMYVLVPMPYLFFGGGTDTYGYSSIASGCASAMTDQTRRRYRIIWPSCIFVGGGALLSGAFALRHSALPAGSLAAAARGRAVWAHNLQRSTQIIAPTGHGTDPCLSVAMAAGGSTRASS
jgi:hypothetical protein